MRGKSIVKWTIATILSIVLLVFLNYVLGIFEFTREVRLGIIGLTILMLTVLVTIPME